MVCCVVTMLHGLAVFLPWRLCLRTSQMLLRCCISQSLLAPVLCCNVMMSIPGAQHVRRLSVPGRDRGLRDERASRGADGARAHRAAARQGHVEAAHGAAEHRRGHQVLTKSAAWSAGLSGIGAPARCAHVNLACVVDAPHHQLPSHHQSVVCCVTSRWARCCALRTAVVPPPGFFCGDSRLPTCFRLLKCVPHGTSPSSLRFHDLPFRKV